MKRNFSRRSFLAASVATLGIGAGSIISPQARAATPQKGGILKFGMAGGASTDSFDPRTYADSVPIFQGYTVMNGLIEIDDKNRAQPELLESWEIANKAKEWIFNVRKNVPFHNGKMLDAEDIIYSLNLHRGENAKSGASSLLKLVTDIQKMSSHQIKITLSQSDSDFLYTLGDFHFLVVPKDFSDWQHPIGTGGYILESYEPGVRMVAKRFPDYWKPNCANVDRVDLTVINDTPARMNALLTGQVDAISRADVRTVSLLENAPNLKVTRSPGGWHAIMAMQTDKAPYNDLNTRLALRYAADREQILKVLFNGYGSIGNDHPIPKSDPYFNSELAQITFDPDRAKSHAQKAGLGKTAFTLSASDAAFDSAVNSAVLFQESAKKAGLQINVKRESPDGFWNDVWLKAPFCLSYWAGRAAATQMLEVAYYSGAVWNETHWRNEKFDKLLFDAKAEADENKRKPYIWEMQKILHDEGGAIIPVFADWLDAAHSKVKGLTPHGIANFNNLRLAEKAWVEG